MAAEVRGWCIFGRVQGVFFRASTQRKARRLGLAGYAINQADGTVVVAARGESAVLDELASWLEQGPPAARVDRVDPHQPDVEAIPTASFATG